MSGFEFLDLVIGLIFIYLIYSLACSTLWEIAVNFTFLRGKMLQKWFLNTFKNSIGDEEVFAHKILSHPLIQSLSKSGKMPSYISSRQFSEALVDLIVNLKKTGEGQVKYTLSEIDINNLKESLKKLTFLPDELKGVLLQYISEAEGKIEKVKEQIAHWYDDAMDRVGGSFKKFSQRWILAFAVVLVGFTNADSLRIVTYLYDNPTAREAIANKAALFVQDSTVVKQLDELRLLPTDSIKPSQQEALVKINANLQSLNSLNKELKGMSFPIGWNGDEALKGWNIVKKIAGLLITAFAVSMGAPFWFETLNKLVNLRSSGNKPPETKNTKS